MMKRVIVIFIVLCSLPLAPSVRGNLHSQEVGSVTICENFVEGQGPVKPGNVFHQNKVSWYFETFNLEPIGLKEFNAMIERNHSGHGLTTSDQLEVDERGFYSEVELGPGMWQVFVYDKGGRLLGKSYEFEIK